MGRAARCLLVALGLVAAPLAAQGVAVAGGGSDHGALAGSTRLTLGLGHTSLSQGVVEGRTRWLAVPHWSINVDRWLTDRLAVAVQGDLVIESYKVEHGGAELLERAYPVALVPALLWKPWHTRPWAFVGGIGAEIAGGHALALTRLGAEYGVHLGPRHEVGVALVWDNKWSWYNSFGLSFTVTRRWPRAH